MKKILIITMSLLLVLEIITVSSCASTPSEEQEVTSPQKEEVAQPEEEETVTSEGEQVVVEEEDIATPEKEAAVTEENKIVTPAEEETETEEDETPSTPMPRGNADPDIQIDIYDSNKAYTGTTLLTDIHNTEKPRIIEVNMLGKVVWEYLVPQDLKRYTGGGFDVEWLENDNILFVLPRKGVYEINRSGEIVWSYLTNKISHDADRLPNGNTIFVWGFPDKMEDAQVTEITPEGKIVWAWYAKDHLDKSTYNDIYQDGWTHTNAVTRLANGNTLISPRNFQFVILVDPQGSIIKTIGEGKVYDPHDPEVLTNGNILVASLNQPPRAVEIDSRDRIVWEFRTLGHGIWHVRDTDRLPNGNTLLCGTTQIVEITTSGEIVWQLSLKNMTEDERPTVNGFFKAERVR
ncbi:aryl-sulfate sulfotransferase [Chloroflexota bacterium]